MYALVLMILNTAGYVFGARVAVVGDLVSVYAKNEPLQTVLAEFVNAGIEVKIDPTIRKEISVQVNNEPIETVLSEILSPYGYALSWDTISSPLGEFPHLSQIRIFRIGQKQALQSIPYDNVLTVTREWNGEEYVYNELLISFRPGTSVEEFQRLMEQLGATVVDCNEKLGIYRIRFAPGTNIKALVQQLQANSLVAGVEPNYVYRTPEGTRDGSLFKGERTRLALPAADGVAPLAILDSGLQAVAGLDQAVIGSYDAFNPDGSISDPVGHGTQMALIASGAVVPGGAEASGLGQGVPLLAVKAFDANGATSNFDLMRSIDYALANGAKVINLSWGSETPSRFIEYAIKYAQSRGVFIVASAGNEPINRPVYPAAYSGVLAVGALDEKGGLWENSNYGDFIDLTAPGAAQMPVGYKGPPGSYAGTSIAGAYVSSVIAQYLMNHPKADNPQTLRALAGALTDAGEPGRDDKYGAGKLDAAAVRRFLQR